MNVLKDNMGTGNRLSLSREEIKEFGSYPQTRVRDKSLEEQLTALLPQGKESIFTDEWNSYQYFNRYMELPRTINYRDIEKDGEKYRGVYFTVFAKSYSDFTEVPGVQIGGEYEPYRIYWFKFEPLKWWVANIFLGNAVLICENIPEVLNYERFRYLGGSPDLTSSDWENSELRRFLNEEFYDTAFTDSEKEMIKETYNLSTSGKLADTTEKVYILSEDEACNKKYGFRKGRTSPCGKRRKKGTDYSECRGLEINYRNGTWWLRSSVVPRVSCYGMYVDETGCSDKTEQSPNMFHGVVPVIRVKAAISGTADLM